MKEFNISIFRTWNGKVVGDMTTKERLSMEAEFKKRGMVVSYSYEADCNSEVKIPEPPKPRPITTEEMIKRVLGEKQEVKKPVEHTVININGHSYSSWEEAMKGEAASGNVRVVNNTAGSTVTIAGGKVIVGGQNKFGFDPAKENVYIFVTGNVDRIEVPAGTVTTKGNIGDVHANAGNVTCKEISGSVHANCGNIKADVIKGDVHSNMGHVTYNGK